MTNRGMSDDAQLIAAARAGERPAFGALVERYQDRLFHSLLHALGSREDALDACQEAFVQAYVKLERFQEKSQFYTWLYRIAVNRASSMHRRRRPKPTVDVRNDDGAKHALEPVDETRPSRRLEQSEDVQSVRDALATLSDDHRQIIVLREMDELSYEQIAEILDTPIGTVRSRLARARLQLKCELERVMADEEDRSAVSEVPDR